MIVSYLLLEQVEKKKRLNEMNLEPKYLKAPEIYGNHWLNGEPISIHNNENLVLFIHFWDYTDTSCIRTFPYLNEWQKKYRDMGLLVIGIHTPEFEFAKSLEFVEKAVSNYDLKQLIVLDNAGINRQSYGVRDLPTSFLIDRERNIRFIHYGEGNYLEIEREIQQLLIEANFYGNLPSLTIPFRKEDAPGAVCYHQTRKLYTGYLKGALANPEGYNPESTIEYADPHIYISGKLYAIGKWKNRREYLQYNGEKEEVGSIIVPYSGCDVNVIMGSQNGSLCKVLIQLDDEFLNNKFMGVDCTKGLKDDTILNVDVHRVYNVVHNEEFGNHVLKLITSDKNLEIYAFTFTTCIIQELAVSN